METNRILLRSWQESDAPELFQLANNEKVGLACGWLPHKNEEESLEILRNTLITENSFAIVEKSDKKLIGAIGVNHLAEGEFTKTGDVELGYWLGEDFWGKGYMQEAVALVLDYCFDELGKDKVWCAHFEDNQQSRRFQEKFGFVYHHKDEALYNGLLGVFYNSCVNVMTKEHWEAMKNDR
jgi:[ribosomal protein S5]-alanine N-acetyltransferase